MKNRWLLNLALALLAGMLILVAVFRPGTKPEPAVIPLTALAADEVRRIRLLRPGQPEVVVEKSADRWHLTAPRAARANGFRVNELLRLASTPVRARFPAIPAELGQYGLDKPMASVFLNDAEIRFGAMHPLQNDLYVQYAGQVQLVAAASLRAAGTPLEDLLSPSLLDDKTKLLSLRLPGLHLKQNEQGAWTSAPELKDISSDQVNRLVDEWRYARALAVMPHAGKPARERIAIVISENDRPRTIEFGIVARRPELVLVRFDEKLEYHFQEDAGARLLELKPEPDTRAPAEPAAR